MAKQKNTEVGCFGQILVLLFLFAIVKACSNLTNTSNNEVKTTTNPPVEDNSWIPSGFNRYSEDENIAIKWSDNNNYSCSSLTGCTQLEVISKNGCSSLYAELTKLDAAQNNVGYTNETTSDLRPKQKAILKFDLYGDNVKSVRIAKINCY